MSTNRDNPPRLWAMAGLILTVATFVAFWPVVRCEFLQFDDPDYVAENEWVRNGLTWPGFVQAFQDVRTGNWHPVTWLSHMLDVQLFGLSSAGHHFVNLVFHTANAVLLLFLLWRLTGALWRSAFVAALFALHPLHVESVAWVSERKDVLSGFFFLLTLWAYARFAQCKMQNAKCKMQNYVLALLFFTLGLMSKPMLVTLPFVLLLLDYWPLKRVASDKWQVAGQAPTSPVTRHSSLLFEKIPFFALALVACVVTFQTQLKGGAVAGVGHLPFSARLINAVVSYSSYLKKTFWPSDLAVFYPYTAGPELPKLLTLAAILVGITAVVMRVARRRPYLAVGWFWFGGMLVPVTGLVQVGLQSMADRYTYLPLIGLFLTVVWGTGDLIGQARRGRNVLVSFLVLVLAACAITSWAQVRYWQNGVTLFTRALEVTPNNAFAQYNLGVALAAHGQTDEACAHFTEAVELDPENADALNNAGLCLVLQGDTKGGLDCYRKALALRPDYPEVHYNLGLALAAGSDLTGAIEQYREAVRLKPDFADAHTKLGLALIQTEEPNEAAVHFQAALRSRPDAQAHRNLAGTLILLNDPAGAVAQYREALCLKPDWPDALNLLAWLLATHGNPEIRKGAEAVRLSEKACALTGQTNAFYLGTLAAAYAEVGRFGEAVGTSERSLALTGIENQSDFAEAERQRLEIYRMNRPFHQE